MPIKNIKLIHPIDESNSSIEIFASSDGICINNQEDDFFTIIAFEDWKEIAAFISDEIKKYGE